MVVYPSPLSRDLIAVRVTRVAFKVGPVIPDISKIPPVVARAGILKSAHGVICEVICPEGIELRRIIETNSTSIFNQAVTRYVIVRAVIETDSVLRTSAHGVTD